MYIQNFGIKNILVDRKKFQGERKIFQGEKKKYPADNLACIGLGIKNEGARSHELAPPANIYYEKIYFNLLIQMLIPPNRKILSCWSKHRLLSCCQNR